jgi:subtilisin family serine protease
LDTAIITASNNTNKVTFAIAAGNFNADACNYSPADVAQAIVAGAIDSNDARASFSNFGACVDLFAPGVQVNSDWDTSDTATKKQDGTSESAPFVAGRIALYLAHHSGATPAQVQNSITTYSPTHTYIVNAGAGSPQRIVYTF